MQIAFNTPLISVLSDQLSGSYNTEAAEVRHQLHGMKRRVGDLQGELKHLRRIAQVCELSIANDTLRINVSSH